MLYVLEFKGICVLIIHCAHWVLAWYELQLASDNCDTEAVLSTTIRSISYEVC